MSLLYPREMLDQIIKERDLQLESSERDTLYSLVDTVFFASMMIEEGEPVRVAVVHVEGGASALAEVEDASPQTPGEQLSPALAWDVTPIVRQRFDPTSIAKMSPAVRYGTHLIVVGGMAPDLWIDGVARRTPRTDGGGVTRIAAPRPGVVVFEEGDEELLRFDAGRRVPPSTNVFTNECPVRKIIEAITGRRGCEYGYSDHEWALLRLLRKMRAVGHGAILALLAKEPEPAVIEKVRYRRVDPNLLPNRISAERTALYTSIASAMPIEGKVDVEDAYDASDRKIDMYNTQARTAGSTVAAAAADVVHG